MTATPPLGDDLRVSRSPNCAALSAPIVSATSFARFSRICTGVRVEVGMSKYSPCRLKSASENFQKSSGAIRATCAKIRESAFQFAFAVRSPNLCRSASQLAAAGRAMN